MPDLWILNVFTDLLSFFTKCQHDNNDEDETAGAIQVRCREKETSSGEKKIEQRNKN